MKRKPCMACAHAPTGLCDRHGARDGTRTETIVVRCNEGLQKLVKARAQAGGMSIGRTAEELIRRGLLK